MDTIYYSLKDIKLKYILIRQYKFNNTEYEAIIKMASEMIDNAYKECVIFDFKYDNPELINTRTWSRFNSILFIKMIIYILCNNGYIFNYQINNYQINSYEELDLQDIEINNNIYQIIINIFKKFNTSDDNIEYMMSKDSYASDTKIKNIVLIKDRVDNPIDDKYIEKAQYKDMDDKLYLRNIVLKYYDFGIDSSINFDDGKIQLIAEKCNVFKSIYALDIAATLLFNNNNITEDQFNATVSDIFKIKLYTFKINKASFISDPLSEYRLIISIIKQLYQEN